MALRPSLSWGPLPPGPPLPASPYTGRSRGSPTACRSRSHAPGKPGSSPAPAGGCSEPQPRRGSRGPQGPRSGATHKPMVPFATRRWATYLCSQDPTREPRSLPATPPCGVPAPAAQPGVPGFAPTRLFSPRIYPPKSRPSSTLPPWAPEVSRVLFRENEAPLRLQLPPPSLSPAYMPVFCP